MTRTERLAGVLLMTMLMGCGGIPDIANRDATGTAIVCFGDSLTYGYNAAAGRDYPSHLAAALGRDVINAGVNGDTTRDALARLDADVLSHHPRLVIVTLGGNDFLQQVPLPETVGNIDVIVRRIQEYGAMVALVAVPSGLLGDPARQAYERIARERRAAWLPDVLEGVLDDPQFKSDNVHPNEAGYQRMAERILAGIRPLLEEIAP